MRFNIFAYSFIAMLVAGCAGEGVIVEKRSRPIPDSSIPGLEGVHSFVFRGPTGTSRLPITVPGKEFWPLEPNTVCSFLLRDRQGNVRSQLVTPEVFARYQTGGYFNDLQSPLTDGKSYDSSDGKDIRTAAQYRRAKTYARHKARFRRSHRALAKRHGHYRHHSAQRRKARAHRGPKVARKCHPEAGVARRGTSQLQSTLHITKS